MARIEPGDERYALNAGSALREPVEVRLEFDAFTGDDDDAVDAAKRKLLAGFGQWLEAHPVAGVEVADVDVLLDWKYRYADGHLGSWSRADVDEVLLEHLPRKLTASPVDAASFPVSLGAFVHYLEDTGSLADRSDRAETVAARAMAQSQAFLDAMDDPSNWGMAKRLLGHSGLGNITELDDLDPEAMEAAMARFNALPFEERDRILGPGPFGADDLDHDDVPTLALPLRLLPPLDALAVIAPNVPMLRQVEALRQALGADGIKLTAAGNPTLADGRRLVDAVGTGDPVEGVRSSAELTALFAVGRVAVEALAIEIDGQRLRAVADWPDETSVTRWRRVVEAVIECGASSVRFGAVTPMEDQLAGVADEGAVHFIAMLWLAGEPLPIDAFADRVHDVTMHDRRGSAVSARPARWRRDVCRARVGEVVDSFVAAGIVTRTGDKVELTAPGARIVAPLLEEFGYEVLLPEALAELDAAELLDLLVERGDDVDVVAACWRPTTDRGALAGELVSVLVADPHPERVMLGAGVLGAFGDAAVGALWSAVETPIAAQAWMLLVSAGAVGLDEAPPEMMIEAGIDAFVGMARAGAPADVIESMLGHLPMEEHVTFVDRIASTAHPRTAELLDLVGRHHPDKGVAKHARKTAHRWRSRHAVPKH